MADQPPESRLSNGVQAELIPLENLPDDFYIEEESSTDKDGNARQPRYTAERFFRKRPEDYQLCVRFLGARMGLLQIARLLKVHHKTVAAVRDVEAAQIDIQKERIKRNLRTAIDVGAERLPDIMAEMAGGSVPISIAVLLDKLALLEGEPTSRVEVTVKGHLSHAAIAANIEAFPDAIEVDSTVSQGDLPGQKALADGSQDPAAGDSKSPNSNT